MRYFSARTAPPADTGLDDGTGSADGRIDPDGDTDPEGDGEVDGEADRDETGDGDEVGLVDGVAVGVAVDDGDAEPVEVATGVASNASSARITPEATTSEVAGTNERGGKSRHNPSSPARALAGASMFPTEPRAPSTHVSSTLFTPGVADTDLGVAEHLWTVAVAETDVDGDPDGDNDGEGVGDPEERGGADGVGVVLETVVVGVGVATGEGDSGADGDSVDVDVGTAAGDSDDALALGEGSDDVEAVAEGVESADFTKPRLDRVVADGEESGDAGVGDADAVGLMVTAGDIEGLGDEELGGDDDALAPADSRGDGDSAAAVADGVAATGATSLTDELGDGLALTVGVGDRSGVGPTAVGSHTGSTRGSPGMSEVLAL